MSRYTEQVEQLLFAEARESALIDYITGNLPDDLKAKQEDVATFLDRIQYSHIFANDGKVGVTIKCPDWQSNDIQDALRLDGCDEFVIKNFDEHFEFEAYRVWWEGMKRCYREIGHGSAIEIRLAPAGTLEC